MKQLLFFCGLWLGTISGQAQVPHLWNPAAADPQFEARKLRLSASATARAAVAGSAHKGTASTVARPACFEPFDTTAAGGWTSLGRNDDDSFGPVSLGWNFSLFGNRYSEVYINNNGNITFDAPYGSFNAQGFPLARPMIAPFWADVDTQNPASGTVWYKVFPDRLVVVWSKVGYFNRKADKKNTFQLVIKANTAPGFSGNDVLFAYDDMQWTTSDASSGTGGFGGIPASVGVNKGNSVDYIQTGRFNLSGSLAPNTSFPGNPGGVDWLDGLCLGYRVRDAGNVPPAVAGLPAGNLLTVNQGQTVVLPLQFSGPETDETVSVSSNFNGGTFCNASVSTAGNGGTNPTLTFSVTGAPCNVGTRTINFTATDNGLPAPAQSVFALTVVVNPANGQWTGAANTAYTNPANWNNNTVPAATDNVTIPAGVPNMPVLSTSAAVGSLTVATGASLTVASGGALSLSGALTNNGTIGGAGTLLTTGSAAQSFGGSNGLRIANLTVGSAGVQLTRPLAVTRLLTLNGNLASNGNLTLAADASGTAMAVNNDAAAVLGTATVQCYLDPALNPGLGYRHLAAPVANTTLADLTTAGFSPLVNAAYNGAANPGQVTPFPNIFFYNQALVAATGNGATADFDKGWVSPAATTEAMTPGRGYTVNLAAGQTIDFVGTLGNGAVAIGALGRGVSAQAGWHLLGNPYPAPINWTQAFAGASGLDNAVHVYKSSGQYAGTYASYVNGVGTNGGTNVIGLGQGFFVRASTPGATASLNLSNAARLSTYTSAAPQRGTAETRLLLQLSLSGAGATDQAAVYFETGATAGFDAAFDAPKLTAGHRVQLALDDVTGPLAISGRPLLGNAPLTVPLAVRVAQAGTYTLRADELLNLPVGATVQLRDALTGTVTPLTPQVTYTFTADASLAGPRFSLIFQATRALATAPGQLSAQVVVFPNPAHQQLWLAVPGSSQAVSVRLVNALGQLVLRQELPVAHGAGAQALAVGHAAPGVYTLHVALPEGVVTKRVVIE
ncbi:T9SS type A sorting domain-containing protein [Hymenobacter sp. 5317J-9]|uniref:nidogen-like domain-containing protein n=1 Tax=Hymenobacter sp. 5317J-9 TaxID=2932250 RepID=UPI001FD68F42|nr:nidogen-like domain-containing protein [Hymenobacter sp. 5317J-9]UOQ99937.1 T9SS type A sorting domain-containing protein [Hymenobacter sp. 5317J-9]